MSNIDIELMNKAKAAKNPEELLELAKKNGFPDMDPETAENYFDRLSRSGEISDEELDSAAGGCKKGGRRMVSLGNLCPGDFWVCKHCLLPANTCVCSWDKVPDLARKLGNVSIFPNVKDSCSTCGWCSYEGGTWYCNNSNANKV